MTAVLTTERLVLRPLRLADAPAIQREFGRWEIIQFMSTVVPWPYPDDGAESFLREHALPAVSSGASVFWALTLRGGDDTLIGLLEWRTSTADDADNRGFWLAVDHQGRGLMTEAVVAFQDHVFFELGVARLRVHNAVANPRSRRIKEKTGGRLLGGVEMDFHLGLRDAEQWEITREGWAAHRGR